jgi:hypothetical protein
LQPLATGGKSNAAESACSSAWGSYVNGSLRRLITGWEHAAELAAGEQHIGGTCEAGEDGKRRGHGAESD